MQPVKISIKGDFYDCQIYRGRLYLWTFDGDLKVYDWWQIVNSLIKTETDKIAMTFCFLDGNYLYKQSLLELFKDKDFRKLLLRKFDRINNKSFNISEKQIEKFLIGNQETPTGILPTDTEVYSNKLFFIHEQGLFTSSAHRERSEKYLVSSRPVKLWDCNLLSNKANRYPQLALSGGDDGLFELNMAKSLPDNLKRIEDKAAIFQISNNHSSFCNYSFLNIYNSSLVEDSFMATFKWHMTKDKNQNDVAIRNFEGSITDKEIFKKDKSKSHFVSWGIEDKIYKATSRGFEVIKHNNYADEEKGEIRFQPLQSINIHPWKGEVIGGGTSYFGNIVECENALIVIQSDEKTLTIPGPITRWRVYPRSLNYENHLHVILDNSIEIYSFNHDYFLNQDDKNIGIQFVPNKQIHFNRGRANSNVSYFEDTNENLFSVNGNDLPF